MKQPKLPRFEITLFSKLPYFHTCAIAISCKSRNYPGFVLAENTLISNRPNLARFHFQVDKMPRQLQKCPRMSVWRLKIGFKLFSYISATKPGRFHIRARIKKKRQRSPNKREVSGLNSVAAGFVIYVVFHKT